MSQTQSSMNPLYDIFFHEKPNIKKFCFEEQKKKFTAVVFHFEAAKQGHNNFKTETEKKRVQLSANTSVSIDAAYVFTHAFTCQNFDQVWVED